MSGSDVSGLIERIDASIADSEERIQSEVAEYIERHPVDVGLQIANDGFAVIPTFAGDFRLSLEQLRELAADPAEFESVGS